jgi:outer membrane protein assembly factor BamB
VSPLRFVAVLVALLLLAASPASTGVSVSPNVSPPGSTIRVSGSGFEPTEAVDLFLDRADVAVSLADASGAVALDAKLPVAWGLGRHWATLLGRGTGVSTQTTIVAGATAPSPWPQSGAVPAQTGFAEQEGLLTAANAQRLELAWSGVPENGLGEVIGGAVSSGTLTYVLQGAPPPPTRRLEAFRADGTIAWSQPILGSAANMRLQGWWGTPLAFGAGVVIVQTFRVDLPADRVILAFDAETGSPRWRVTLPCPTCASVSPDEGWLIGWGSPTVAGDVLYVPINAWSPGGVPTRFGQVCALEMRTGAVSWCKEIDDPTDVAASGNRLVVGSQARRRVMALDAATGDTLWTIDLEKGAGGYSIAAGPAIVGDRVIVADYERLYALRLADGVAEWTWTHDGAKPFVSDGRTVYVADHAIGDPWWCEGAIDCHPDDARLWALSTATGAQRWHRSFGQRWFAGIVGADGLIYAMVADAVVIVRAGDGKVVSTVAGGGRWRGARGGLLIADGVFYVTDNGGVVAYATTRDVPRPDPRTLEIRPGLAVPTVAPPVAPSAAPPPSDPDRWFRLMAVAIVILALGAIVFMVRARSRSAPRRSPPPDDLPRSAPSDTATPGRA